MAVALTAAIVLALGASEARPAGGSPVTITMLENPTTQPAFDVLIPNFERVYPNVTVDVTYGANSVATGQTELTELAAGSGPDILPTIPGRTSSTAVYELAGAGDLAPLVDEPWARRSLPLVTSLSKVGQVLYAFLPSVTPFGLFTNTILFAKLGLKVPQTFEQLLDLCQKAKADGTVAVDLPGGSAITVEFLLLDLAASTVYAKNSHWSTDLLAGKVSFDGTPGWHQALQQFIDMNDAGCFEPGLTSTPSLVAAALFAQGGALTEATASNQAGTINAADPQFQYSFYPFPSAAKPSQTTTAVLGSNSLAINAHSSSQNQAAAKEFIDFLARPKQDALFAQLTGGLTQYQFLKDELPQFMSPFTSTIADREYVFAPVAYWWNPNVEAALQTYQIGLVTGQSSIDDVLNAMDAAWKQGPS